MSKKKRSMKKIILITLGIITVISVIANITDDSDNDSSSETSVIADTKVITAQEEESISQQFNSNIPDTESQYTQSETSMNVFVNNDPPYKRVADKTDFGGFVTNKVEIYVTKDRDYKRMYEFVKSLPISSDTMYHVHFFDDEQYAILPEGGARSLYWDNENMKHIIAEYTRNTVNDFAEFVYYEENKYEGSPKHLN